MIEHLAWVTTAPARGRDVDAPLAVPALRAEGVRVEVVDWDDPAVDWSRFDRVVLRSTWDYPERLAEFGPWLERVDTVTDLVNPLPVIRWSHDKRYLAELASAGVPVTPTRFVEPGSEVVLPGDDFVVKPAVGAGSREVASYGPGQHRQAHEHVTRLHEAGQVALVQPYLRSVAGEGEWPMIFLEGGFSHAANKRITLPRAGRIDGLFAEETNAAHDPSPEQLAVAEAAMGVVTDQLGAPTYGRVDLVRDDEGGFRVLEVELVEPSLFLPCADSAAVDRFVAALLR
ncbi:hypothetical protein MWU75_12550 [Ornithinimicrobium sp. F0845]|uniref:ATP-grasp domain-containing protein n=1 Tax=Ornithinimicrobium sp. F0845 TaxID=2926412 RepID=UPI001FF6C6D4|nr:hypothetical protein [Ornithinimicrobium sp. F0845]MCK0112971.1 hypothetical protein [Ornithinimicrobium sp. F0845]